MVVCKPYARLPRTSTAPPQDETSADALGEVWDGCGGDEGTYRLPASLPMDIARSPLVRDVLVRFKPSVLIDQGLNIIAVRGWKGIEGK